LSSRVRPGTLQAGNVERVGMLMNGLRATGALLCFALVALLASIGGAWGALALWYRAPGSRWLRAGVAAGWLLATLALLALAAHLHAWWPLACAAAMHAVLLTWWHSIAPTHDRIWADDVARLLRGRLDGHMATLHNVRNFNWRSASDYDVRWETQSFDLDRLVCADAVLSHWGSRAIAHAMLSFGFDDGRHLVFSVEIRKRRGQAFSAIGGFFRDFESTLVAATESDIVRVRTNVRGEDVYLYPLDIDATAMRALFASYLESANRLRTHPAFYNTITSNCTTMVHRMARQLDPGLPWDARLLLTGYLPGYLYKIGAIDRRLPLHEWTRRASISARARGTPPARDFSAAIRTPRD
jgi:hypothetical protein